MPMSLKDEILLVLKEFNNGPLTVREIAELISKDEPNIGSVSASLSHMWSEGTVLKNKRATPLPPGKKGRTWVYEYSLNTDPNPTPPVREMRRKKPTAAGYEARLAEKDEQIAELVRWQADAIARYPDLAVLPALLKARKIVANVLKSRNDKRGANDVLAGHMDSSILIQATLAAIEEEE